MSKKFNRTALSIAVGTSLAAVIAGTSFASTEQNPFALTELSSGYRLADAGMAEGKCGSDKTKEEARCGANKAKNAHDAKCGSDKKKMSEEAKCGTKKKKVVEAKCGEAKCGNNKRR
jgi:uncharacterized low-complexity protein